MKKYISSKRTKTHLFFKTNEKKDIKFKKVADCFYFSDRFLAKFSKTFVFYLMNDFFE